MQPIGACARSPAILASPRTLVHGVWKRFDVQPHRVERFKLSNDPKFEEKVRDVVGLYLDPPERALVLCVDEKSQIQALDRTAPILPLRPGLPERQTHDYKRHGTTTLFAAFNILNGKVIGSCLPRHRSKEFIKFLNQLEKEVSAELDVHLILGQLQHAQERRRPALAQTQKRRRFHFHFTPTSGSWLNQVERFFGLITDKMIRRGTFLSARRTGASDLRMARDLERKTQGIRLESHGRRHSGQSRDTTLERWPPLNGACISKVMVLLVFCDVARA